MRRFFLILAVLLALMGVVLHWLGYRYGIALTIASIGLGVALLAGRNSEDRKTIPPAGGG